VVLDYSNDLMPMHNSGVCQSVKCSDTDVEFLATGNSDNSRVSIDLSLFYADATFGSHEREYSPVGSRGANLTSEQLLWLSVLVFCCPRLWPEPIFDEGQREGKTRPHRSPLDVSNRLFSPLLDR
jgi:hypothetical protein